ncbi:hypothetical protein BER93_14930 [Xanthomonas fragariae]|nr:hypothetical protein BER92_14895 [Xanthomonas fragariae]AOD19170.1 hypothetical protein BER93_14930 [Xanthomonas fragariae]
MLVLYRRAATNQGGCQCDHTSKTTCRNAAGRIAMGELAENASCAMSLLAAGSRMIAMAMALTVFSQARTMRSYACL